MGVTAGQAAIFNAYAYYADTDPVSKAVIAKPGAPQLPPGWTAVDVVSKPENQGQHTVVFGSADSSEFFVAERGTANLGDVVRDSQFVTQLPMTDERAAGVKDVVEKYQEQYPGADFYLGGHSLGGDVMKQVSGRTGLPAFVESTPARFSQTSGPHGEAKVIEMRDARDPIGMSGPSGPNDIVIHNGADPERNSAIAAHSSANMAAAINADPALRDIELGKPIDAIGLMGASASLIGFKIRQEDGSSFRWQNPDGRSTEPTIQPQHTSGLNSEYGFGGSSNHPWGIDRDYLGGSSNHPTRLDLAHAGASSNHPQAGGGLSDSPLDFDWFDSAASDARPVMSSPSPPEYSPSDDYADFDTGYSSSSGPAGASGIYNSSSGSSFSSTQTYTSSTGSYDGANTMSGNIIFGSVGGIITGYDYNHFSDTAFA